MDFYDPESKKRIETWEFCDDQGKLLKMVKYVSNGQSQEIFESPEYDSNFIW